jgi:hypothetical protein
MSFFKNCFSGKTLFKKKKKTFCVESDCESECDFNWKTSRGPQKLFTKDENLKDRLVGVVVTIYEGSSYDEMFREIRPQTVPGERVSTYSIGCCDVKLLNDYLSAALSIPEDQPLWKCLVDDINQVQADSVTFNWECCSACGDYCFPCMSGSNMEPMQDTDIDSNSSPFAEIQDSWSCTACTLINEASALRCMACDALRPTAQDSTQNSSQTSWSCPACTLENEAAVSTCATCNTVRPPSPEPESQGNARESASTETMEFMALALNRGHTVMCSDFSLKSLIYEWSEQHLGPHPFIKVGEVSQQFQLDFVPSDLTYEDVPQQLQVVGELCRDQGKAFVNAMSNTILYTVDPKRSKTGAYDLKVLTVVTDTSDGLPNLNDEMKCSIGEGESMKKGAAGHVTLTYPSGGQLVTSMGHWIELTRIDTTLESVLRAAEHNFGVAEAADFRAEYYSKNSGSERAECLQKRAHKLVSQSVPTKMKCRTKF